MSSQGDVEAKEPFNAPVELTKPVLWQRAYALSSLAAAPGGCVTSTTTTTTTTV